MANYGMLAKYGELLSKDADSSIPLKKIPTLAQNSPYFHYINIYV